MRRFRVLLFSLTLVVALLAIAGPASAAIMVLPPTILVPPGPSMPLPLLPPGPC